MEYFGFFLINTVIPKVFEINTINMVSEGIFGTKVPRLTK